MAGLSRFGLNLRTGVANSYTSLIVNEPFAARTYKQYARIILFQKL